MIRNSKNTLNSFFENYEYQFSNDFDAVKINIASPEDILSWSYGEVTRPDTINYRTLKPERSGLFCAKIFGPVQSYTCLCGKYKKNKFHGVICEKCGVEVTDSYVRRSRMAHISLCYPVVHVLHMRSVPSRIATLLNITSTQLNQIVYLHAYVVMDEGLTDIPRGMIVDEDKKNEIQDKYGDEVIFDTGAQAILDMLKAIDISKEISFIQESINSSKSSIKVSKHKKRKALLESFYRSKNRPEWMVLTHIPVLPPELRPLVPIEGLRFASSDLNDLYRRIINRNNRLKHLTYVIDAPESVIKSEKRMLQEAVDALFANGKNGKTVTGSNNRPLKCLESELKGKKGIFRHNLLGKRVDYSGRSVIAIGSDLKLHQCGLPKDMALELFRPFIYFKLLSEEIVPSLKAAKNMVDSKDPAIWEILKEITYKHPILLNRAPTLHRLSMQAFEPVLIDGKAILVHPLVCSAFNADFDGDMMGVYVPISVEAQLEARTLMLATNNLLSPASGDPIAIPTQDYVLGIYWLTLNSINDDIKYYNSVIYVIRDLDTFEIDYRQLVCVKVDQEYVKTTAGRILLYHLCKNIISIQDLNKNFDKGSISDLIKNICYCLGLSKAINVLDVLLQEGKKHATRLGLSFSVDDMDVPQDKYDLIKAAEKDIDSLDYQVYSGHLSSEERKSKVIETWIKVSDDIAKKIVMKDTAFHSMISSGARGSQQQLKQVCGMRGLMSKPNGEIIEAVIKSSFKEGLNTLEYFISTHGTRKGLTDTALQTSKSGYLYRKLFDVAHCLVIYEQDCNTLEGITLETIDNKDVKFNACDRAFGRFLAEDIAVDGQIIKKNTLVSLDVIHLLSGISKIKVRSPVTCACSTGICVMCYGLDLARSVTPNMGLPVGVIAAQSIGEPATQLTMRSFHSGGAACLLSSYESIVMPCNGSFKLHRCSYFVNKLGKFIVNSRKSFVQIFDKSDNFISEYNIPYGAVLHAKDSFVDQDFEIASWDNRTEKIYTEFEGFVKFTNIVNNPLVKEIDEFGSIRRVIVDESRNIPTISIVDKNNNPIMYSNSDRSVEYYLRPGANVLLQEGQRVNIGDVIATYDKFSSQTVDIVGGLNRLIDIFELRTTGTQAVLSPYTGKVSFGKDLRNKITVRICQQDNSFKSIYISKTMNLLVNEGDFITKGEKITIGSVSYKDVFKCMGIEYVAGIMLNDAQKIYYSYGITINDKHLEIIYRQMLRFSIITESDHPLFSFDDIVDNQLLESHAQDGYKINSERLLLGVTKAALESESFLSAASFQETSKVLLEAAVKGKVDNLFGLKESAIVGKLSPIGTGFIRSARSNKKSCRSTSLLTIQEVIDAIKT